MSKHPASKPTEYDEGCLPLPLFERVKYFYGQLLGVREFQSEQRYFLEKHRLHNRYLHGYGVVCGLAVEHCRRPRDPCNDPPNRPAPDPTTPPTMDPTQADPAQATAFVYQPRDRMQPLELPKQLCIEIDCGLALDCQGNEIVVPWPTQIDLLAALGCEARKHFLDGKHAYVTVCFLERPIEPVRPLTADSCGGVLPDCVPSRLRDDFCLRVSWDKPPHDASCSPCARPCCEPCLPLARIGWSSEHGLWIDNSIRRTLAPYVTTKVLGISWVHDGTYRPEDVDEMLHTGLEIKFSGEVRTQTLRRGVIDVWVIQGGGGRHGDIYSAAVEIEPSHPNEEFSHAVTARVNAYRGDRIDPGDRVLVQLRSAFVLDRCCRAVDGDHIGGLVPVIPEYVHRWPILNHPIHPPCRHPEPHPYAPWTSGNGTPAGNFESWFYVGDADDKA
jgi:hypothetical protein